MNKELQELMRKRKILPMLPEEDIKPSSIARMFRSQTVQQYRFHELMSAPAARKRHPYFRLDPWQPVDFRR